jgi:hypothetical protein
MTVKKQVYLQFIWPPVLLAAADFIILVSTQPDLRFGAALVLLLFLPGWVWIRGLAGHALTLLEQVALAVGLSLALLIFGAMVAVYWPGPISPQKLLVMSNLATVAGLIVYKFNAKTQRPEAPKVFVGVSILLVVLLAASLRLPRLGYAEFHEDEVEALMLGVRLFQGEDYALFLHRKGPAQMLVPVSIWLLTGRITESLARFPFALSSTLSVVVIFLIGKRWVSWQAGAVAALLWASNGYAIAFGRMAQYQALIFFLGPLALYGLSLAWELGQMQFYLVGIILLAASLLAHFDALLLLPAAIYLTWLVLSGGAGEQGSRGVNTKPRLHPKGVKNYSFSLQDSASNSIFREENSSSWQSSKLVFVTLALILFFGLLASFYAPYALDPEFKNTITYLTETRVKPGLLYNNLDLFRRLDRDYSSRFYLPLLAIGGLITIGGRLRRANKLLRGLAVGLIILAATTMLLPSLWQLDRLNLAILPWLALLTLGFWTADDALKIAWILFGAAFIGYLFLVDDPRTHVYILYPGAVLISGAGLNNLRLCLPCDWKEGQGVLPALSSPGDLRLAPKTTLHTSRFALRAFAGVMAVWIAVIVTYDTVIFLPSESAFLRLRNRWDNSLWEFVYDDIPTPREYFGYPKREGWKAIGALRAQGQLPGDFRSINEDFVIPIWYNYGQARSCYDTPAHFFVRAAGLDVETIVPESYQPIAQIQREGEVRLRLFSNTKNPISSIETYALEPLVSSFDALATPQYFARQSQPTRPVGTQFGSAILFLGYDLPASTVRPGQTLRLNLYWQALEEPGQDYRAFVHLTDGTMLWGQQDDNPACRLPTSIWRAGQQSIGQFRVPIKADTPPGRYPLVIGLYQAGTLERLKITGGSGQPGDDFLWLGDIEVVKP